jgi:hypothetical protein
MKIIKLSKENKYSKEMEDWYIKRTNNHIELVRKYCQKIIDSFPEFKDLKNRMKVHDDSKFENIEKEPYVFITWKYKCQDEGWDFEDCNPPEDIDDLMHEATLHHILNNSHHPEFHLSEEEKEGDILNKNNRDKPPEKTLDISNMPDLDIAEMCADWCAVSEEKGNTPKSWADSNIGVRWDFTGKQEKLIYNILDEIWE